MVYTLVARNSIDEKIIIRGQKKRVLEKIVIKDGESIHGVKFFLVSKYSPLFSGKFKMNINDRIFAENELKELQKLLEEENRNFKKRHIFSKEELEHLMDRSDLYKMMENQTKDQT